MTPYITSALCIAVGNPVLIHNLADSAFSADTALKSIPADTNYVEASSLDLELILASINSRKNKADKSASSSLNPSIFEGLVTLCAPDAVCFSGHIPHASGRILAERFYVIGTLRSNFLLHKKPS